jgi:hypothetical protein
MSTRTWICHCTDCRREVVAAADYDALLAELEKMRKRVDRVGTQYREIEAMLLASSESPKP